MRDPLSRGRAARLLVAIAGTISAMFVHGLACVWAGAVWFEFIRPSEPVWWTYPVEMSGMLAAIAGWTLLLVALITTPIWTDT